MATSNLSKEFGYVVLTFSGNRYFISAERERELRAAPLDGFFKVNGGIIRVSAIREVLSYGEWLQSTDYQKYVESLPERRALFKGEIAAKVGWTEERRVRAMSRLVEAFRDYWRGREMPTDIKNGLFKEMKRFIM